MRWRILRAIFVTHIVTRSGRKSMVFFQILSLVKSEFPAEKQAL